MIQKALVFYTKPWALTDESTGERKAGITVEYLMAENLNPISGDDGSKGYGYNKESMPSDKLPKIVEIPGYYNLKFALKAGSKGRPMLKLDDIDFVCSVTDNNKK